MEITLKKIVEESTFMHKHAYELEAMFIAIDDAQKTLTQSNYQKVMKQTT